MYFVYILKCADKTLYTGITNDLKRRLKQHKEGKGGSYTRSHGALKIVYKEKHPDKSSALRREFTDTTRQSFFLNAMLK
jgi:putative endonuclease